MTLPRKIMEQCRLCPAKLWSNADFAPQDHRAFVLCPAKSRSLHTLPRKITEPSYFAPRNYRALQTLPREINEQCRLCPAKLQRHSFRGQNNNINYPKTRFYFIFSNFFWKSMLFQRSIQPLGPLFKEKYILWDGTF